MKITEKSQELFKALAQDAGNWGGSPMLGGNVVESKEERGNLTQLKRAGLLSTQKSDGEVFVYFTEAGKAYAATLGIDLSWIR